MEGVGGAEVLRRLMMATIFFRKLKKTGDGTKVSSSSCKASEALKPTCQIQNTLTFL